MAQKKVSGGIMVKDDLIIELQPNIFRLKGEDTSSHSYLIRGDYKNILIDSGVDKNFSKLQKSLLTLGLKIRDIDIIINTHEHFDHIGANRYFQDYSLIAAHRFAATKITVEDRYVTMYKSGDLNEPSLRVHLWLESKSQFDLGNYSLNIIHTPGHTSGSICIYEPVRKILFTGDTVFAGGTLSYIGESGSVGDYIDSISHLATRKINELYPGHGKISKSPEEDMQKAILNARALLRDEGEVEITDFRDVPK
ncbi:MAG: MBL fold metallo-hydrolase [Deltaproteobacteria bacterium]|nr:MBL fold metallo-hydrolase [Deltaproteobacteria bacterium]